jgi:UDP-3-O-[3-hydroxymyristoyl] glucosamine N-acyltransferase
VTDAAHIQRPAYRLGEIVERFGGQLLGDPGVQVVQVATLESAGPTHVSLYTAARYRRQLDATQAGAVILSADLVEATARPRIVCDNPYAYFARLSAFLNPPSAPEPGVHPAAEVHPQAQVDPSARVGPHASIAAGAVIGAGSVIGPNCSIGERARVGEGCRLHANVSIYHDCIIGDRVVLHSGVVIGADGFGLAMEAGRWLKIPQIGRAVIGNDVEVGANTTIDRGAMDDTVIEDGVKLDNQIQIGHNCRIGAHTAIAGCVGIAGSTRIGRYCRIGGSAMIGGHLEIVDRVEISGATAVPKSLLKAGHYSALFPIAPHEDWLRNAAHVRHLDAMHQRLKQLEARLAQLEMEQSR